MPLKILFISAEVAPFAKVGGLADVAGSLPKALRALGHDVRVVMPAYPRIEEQGRAGGLHFREGGMIVPMGIGGIPAGIFEAVLPNSDVPIYFVAQNQLINRTNIYGYNDDSYRFAFFSRAAFEVADRLGWRPDVLHAHDWHTAPAVTWLATAGQVDVRYRGIPSVFTIHNLAHQGLTSWNVMVYLGIITHNLREEPYGALNFMARGIYHATLINTVSPPYGREIMTYEGGAGLNDLLRFRDGDVYGILNGMDYDVWNPQTDKNLARHFDAETLDKRIENKRALQERLGLPQRDDVPLLSMVTRLDAQKGIEIVGHALHLLMNNAAGEAQFVLIGTGADVYENMFRHLGGYHRNKMRAVLAYAADLAPLVYG